MWYVHTMEYYPTLRRREVLLYTTVWINLYEVSRIETESRLIFAQGLGAWKDWKQTANDYKVSFWNDENVLKLTVGVVA